MSGIPQTDIPQGLEKELYFLFTFKDSEHAFLIVPAGVLGGSAFRNGVQVAERWGNPLFLPMNGEHTFRIRYDCTELSSEKLRTYKVRIKAYDSIDLVDP